MYGSSMYISKPNLLNLVGLVERERELRKKAEEPHTERENRAE
jgi:hypothetical protein